MNTIIRRHLSASLFAFAAATLLASTAAVHAATQVDKATTASSNATSGASATARVASVKAPGTITRLPRGNWTVALTASDCRILGGTVITPGDDRCGKPNAAYCRFPDTLAMCLSAQ